MHSFYFLKLIKNKRLRAIWQLKNIRHLRNEAENIRLMRYRFQLSQLNIFLKRILLVLSAFFSSYRLGRTQVFDSNIKISRNRGRKITKNTFLSRLNLYS